MITKSLLNLLATLAFSSLLFGCSNSNSLLSEPLFNMGKPKACKGHYTPLNISQNTAQNTTHGRPYVR